MPVLHQTNKSIHVLLLLTLLLSGCSSFGLYSEKPKLVYQDSVSDSQPNAVIETAYCSNEFVKFNHMVSIWRVSDYNQPELVYRSETRYRCPVVELKPGIYFIAFDVQYYKRGSRRGYGRVVMEAGHRYVFQIDIFHYWWTVWLENAETGEVLLGSKTPY